jgi:hypothetical protein
MLARNRINGSQKTNKTFHIDNKKMHGTTEAIDAYQNPSQL